MTVPRAEYPRPQMVRKQWLCLNGEWEFEIDAGDSGLERGLRDRALKDQIIVPFCPESTLSGIGNTDFLNAVWYRRTVRIPAEWGGQRVLLHFGAIDYDATVWVNGREVARHRGGFTPITCDLKGIATGGDEITIVVRSRDDHRQHKPLGKQSMRYANFGCHYTRTTGIWQTVWIEPVSEKCSFKRPRLTPDVAAGAIHVVAPLLGNARGLKLHATLRDEKGEVVSAQVPADRDFSPRLTLTIPEKRRRLWSPEDPHLYSIDLSLRDGDGSVIDAIETYAGLRSVTIDGRAIKINGKTVFQRLVLDQGFYPDGILTAPTDEALKRDIQLSLDAGFNGARLHQKVFEERFLYWADKLGYLCWGEFADWDHGRTGPEHDARKLGGTYITQWLEAIERDYSHPSIIGWCPLNETWQKLGDNISTLDDITRGMFLATKALDPTRPVLDTSGYSHRVHETDIYDCHDYEQNPEKFAAKYTQLAEGKPWINSDKTGAAWSLPYGEQPFFVSEFGGTWWSNARDPNDKAWGYGDRPKSIEEFYTRFEGLCSELLRNENMFGYCYTQLTDVYQEENGIYAFDRKAKFDLDRIRKIQKQAAAIEIGSDSSAKV